MRAEKKEGTWKVNFMVPGARKTTKNKYKWPETADVEDIHVSDFLAVIDRPKESITGKKKKVSSYAMSNADIKCTIETFNRA